MFSQRQPNKYYTLDIAIPKYKRPLLELLSLSVLFYFALQSKSPVCILGLIPYLCNQRARSFFKNRNVSCKIFIKKSIVFYKCRILLLTAIYFLRQNFIHRIEQNSELIISSILSNFICILL